MAAKLLSTMELAIRDIDTTGRLRPVSEIAVTSLISSIEEIGLQSEIHVRKVRHQGGRLKLITGGHRIEALRRMGCTSIAAKVWYCTDDWATMAEIDDNLAHADLGALDLAVFLAERKTVYERMYPETKADAFKGNRHTGGLATDMMSFARSVAEQRNMSERQIRRLVAAGEGLDRTTVEQLRSAPNRVTLADLQTLAKCGEAKDRSAICEALVSGSAKSAAAALKARRAKPGDAVKSAADKELRKLSDAFARSSKAARLNFARDHQEVLRALLAEVAPNNSADVVTFGSRRAS
tara:strand:- start:205 stop:1086 length:882 start_codon:yes stop_codon:yes gene_type:complete